MRQPKTGALAIRLVDPPWKWRAPNYVWARWIFLRALGLIFFSAFYSLAFQIRGLIGDTGILPAAMYFDEIRSVLPGLSRFWDFPTLFWLSATDGMLMGVVAAGLICSLLLTANFWPKITVSICTILFLSCITSLQVFSSYQSDGMLLEAGVVSIFFAPRGIWPGLGASTPPSAVSLWMLRWEWFRIYFESGVAKLASGDPHWRNFTAMDEYYQNGPLPAWPGWYIQHLPHWYHAATALFTLVVELALVWAVFAPAKHRWMRLACAAIVTALQVGIIATANYAFLNYLVLVLGVLLVDDAAFARLKRPRRRAAAEPPAVEAADPPTLRPSDPPTFRPWLLRWFETVVLAFAFYATIVAVVAPGTASFLGAPDRALQPFRIANSYGLFANMTPARYEIEFQGSRDGGNTWIPYSFRYKPQDPMERPGVYAPYQPRFEWNLWFASLDPWRLSPWVVNAEARLVEGSPTVLALFRGDPFAGNPPPQVRTILWQYWFTDWDTKRKTGAWWRRKELGVFAGTVSRQPDGRLTFTEGR